jgi:protein phosphatase
MPNLDDTQEVPVPNSSASVDPPPAPPSVRLDLGARSDVGRVRANNEDHYFAGRLGRSMRTLLTNLPEGQLPEQFEEAGYVLIVADGMGGAAAGEVASAMAITTAINLSLQNPNWSLRIDEAEARALTEKGVRYFEAIHRELSKRSRTDASLSGMGTTMTVAYTIGLDLFTFHVGDSRAYLFHGGTLERLTKDHTLAQMLVDEGRIPASDLGAIGLKHVLTNVVGATQGAIAPEIRRFRLSAGDRILLCTDGLTDMIDEARIAETLLENESSQAACDALVKSALEAGGKDNVTALVARFAEGSEGAAPRA